jgi:deoxyribose-phosphate aldolase
METKDLDAAFKHGTAARPAPAAIERVPVMPFDPALIANTHINLSAVMRRAASLPARRTWKKEYQAAAQLKAITLMDLTTLEGDETPGRIARLCAKAKNPLRLDLARSLGVEALNITTGAVCVYMSDLPEAVAQMKGTGIPVAVVSTAFPHGRMPLEMRVKEVEWCVQNGANEIDIVIDRGLVLQQKWREVYEEVKLFREAAGKAHLKTILSVGQHGEMDNVRKASMCAMMAGSDFIKTSTGKEAKNASLEVSLVMARAIRDFHEETGYMIGYKPAGGISTAKPYLDYMILMKEELGDRWLQPDLFRVGASSALTDIERQLEHFVTGRYSAAHRHGMG